MSEYDNQGAPNIDEDVRESEVMRKLFVGGINRDTSDEAFFDYFSTYGELVDKVVIHDTNTKASKGFGFITFDKAECVENIFAARPHLLDGKTLDVKRAMPKNLNNSASHFQTTKLFIGGISEELTPEDLQNYIESRHSTSYGTVEKIDFLKERDTNKNKGFGFLECSSPDFADRLVICEASFQLNGKKMSLKKAEPKDGGNRGRGRGVGGGQRGRGRGRGYQNDYSQQANGYYNNYGQGYGQGYNSYQAGSNMGGYAQGGSYGSQSYGSGGQQQGWGQRFAPY